MYPLDAESSVAQVAAMLPRLPQGSHLIPPDVLAMITHRVDDQFRQVAHVLDLEEPDLERSIRRIRLAWREDLSDIELQVVVAKIFVIAIQTT